VLISISEGQEQLEPVKTIAPAQETVDAALGIGGR
jgi:hypothetical protein